MSLPVDVEESAGIYLHWPYCARHCSYCSFTISTEESTRESYSRALQDEIAMVAAQARGTVFDAIYFGGGTPSRLGVEGVENLIRKIRESYRVETGSEITIEANPEDVSVASAAGWKSAGVTRVSLGVQSFQDDPLREIGRIHAGEDASRALTSLVESGLDLSCDLILGLPGQSTEGFLSDVERIVSSGAGHISVYLLELDRASRLADDRRSHPSRYLSDDEQAAAYLEASRRLRSVGFEHYEVSSWARPGPVARHNSKYWNRAPTLGFGVSAHELWNGSRRANTTSLALYIESLGNGIRPTAADNPVGEDEAARERIFLGARTSAGVAALELDAWLARYGDSSLRSDWDQWVRSGLIFRREDRYVLSDEGFLLSSEVLCRFV